MDYIDFINDWHGRRMSVAEFIAVHKTDLIEPGEGGYEYPVLEYEEPSGIGTVYALIHTEGVLYIHPQGSDVWDDDPNIDDILRRYH